MKKLIRDRKGNTFIEYALLASFVAVVAATGAKQLVPSWSSSGTGIGMIFHKVSLAGQCMLDGLDNGSYNSGACNAMAGH